MNGESSGPVLFRSDTDLPDEPGLWRSIVFHNFSLDAQCRIEYANFENGCEFGMYIESASEPVIGASEVNANSFTGCISYGVFNDDTTTCINASHNYWGHANGPDDDSAAVDGRMNAANNNDPGDKVTDDVDYAPWEVSGVNGLR